MHNLRRGRYELGIDSPPALWVVAVFTGAQAGPLLASSARSIWL
jgi:hypothetical protein